MRFSCSTGWLGASYQPTLHFISGGTVVSTVRGHRALQIHTWLFQVPFEERPARIRAAFDALLADPEWTPFPVRQPAPLLETPIGKQIAGHVARRKRKAEAK